jgi:hypothetical protein
MNSMNLYDAFAFYLPASVRARPDVLDIVVVEDDVPMRTTLCHAISAQPGMRLVVLGDWIWP